jgi:Cdc6-like AAA superfamily ATPase
MSYNLNRHKLEHILAEEYKCFLDEMEIPSGIGRNTPLKENIFVIFTCLMNKIPLFVTGKPGSSKTLAMNLVMKSMKGKSSSKEFFKNLPAVLPFSYQGSL